MDARELVEILNSHKLWLRYGGNVGTRADLSGCDLRGADLADKDLRFVNFSGADLRDADLRHAILRRADLRGADLSTTLLFFATLAQADLTGAKLPGVPVVEDLHKKVLEAVGDGTDLDMGSWHHPCGTKHCRAGWAIVLAGEAGEELEDRLGPNTAGALIYQASTGMIPDFYATHTVALEDIKRCAGISE